jgi:hypothetical protein
MYAALPVFSSWLIETGWTRAYWSVDQVGGIGPYLLYTLAYARARAHTHAACGVHTMPAHSRLARLFTGCIVLYVKAHTRTRARTHARTHTHPRAHTHGILSLTRSTGTLGSSRSASTGCTARFTQTSSSTSTSTQRITSDPAVAVWMLRSLRFRLDVGEPRPPMGTAQIRRSKDSERAVAIYR